MQSEEAYTTLRLKGGGVPFETCPRWAPTVGKCCSESADQSDGIAL